MIRRRLGTPLQSIVILSSALAALRSPIGTVAYRAMTVLPFMSMRVKSSGGAGTPTSSQDAPQVLYMLTGARLAELPSKALCIIANACQGLQLCPRLMVHSGKIEPGSPPGPYRRVRPT